MVGHDVRHVAAVLDRVVHPHGRLHVLAHHVDAVREELERVHRAAAVPGVEGGVGGAALELHDHVRERLPAPHVGARAVGRVPREGHVHVPEEPLPGHVDLAADRLLGRGAVVAHGARELPRRDQLLDGDRRAEAGGAEQVVAAAVAGRARLQHGPLGHGLLREARQRVVLAEDGDHRPALAVARDEGGRHAGDAALDAEALLLRVVGEERGRARLAQRRLGEGPHLVGERDEIGPAGVDRGGGRLLLADVGLRNGGRQRRAMRRSRRAARRLISSP